MNKMFVRFALSLLPCSVSLAGLPANGPDLWLTQKGAVLFSENFSNPAIDTNRWTVAKGLWKVENGVLTGKELAADHHSASIRANVPFTNAILQFDFKLDGSRGFFLSVNEAKGHHSRTGITPDGVTISKDRDKKDERSLSLPLGRQNVTFKPGVWYTIVVEYCGNDLLAHINNETFVLGTQEQIGSPKTNFGFPVLGEFASFANVTVWAATPKTDADDIKTKLLAQQAERNDQPADPRVAYNEAETLLRDKLMKEDAAFNQLVNERVAIDTEMTKRWPKAFQTTEAARTLKKKLLTENEEFKALSIRSAKAHQAELNYLLKKSPKLTELRKATLKPQPAK